jgi:hypothetical protein
VFYVVFAVHCGLQGRNYKVKRNFQSHFTRERAFLNQWVACGSELPLYVHLAANGCLAQLFT